MSQGSGTRDRLIFAEYAIVMFGSFKTMYILPTQKHSSVVDRDASPGSLSQTFHTDVGHSWWGAVCTWGNLSFSFCSPLV